ncbi:MAG TPA: 3' terminal RNA ribose 2'-O-methyltransferase Hen1 [Gemmatimonadaceae bacterium]
MLLTLSTSHQPATDLGYLVHKNPARMQEFSLAFGTARVFYPEASEARCTVALLLEIDPVGLVRNRRGPAGEGRSLEQYVNDRPYVASSFLSVAIADVFGSALAGRSKDRPELVAQAIPLNASLAVVRARAGGEDLLRRLFEPLGYLVETEGYPLEEMFPEWGDSPYFTLRLSATKTVKELLTHLYVLIPVLDGDKHYWIGDDEVEKLLRHGEGWLSEHPEKELITRRYLKHRRTLVDDALDRLVSDADVGVDDPQASDAMEEEEVERKISLNEQRLGAVLAALKQSKAAKVLDLGCGEGRLLAALLRDREFTEIVGLDVSHRALEIAADKLHIERMPPMQRQRINLLHGSLIYRDRRLEGFDAAAVVEVIEHLDPPRLAAFERAVFEFAKPGTVVITTPNAEYNVKWETLPAGKFRHSDHRFEWARAQFTAWASGVAERFDYSVRFAPVGPEDEIVGSPTQMGIFTRV